MPARRRTHRPLVAALLIVLWIVGPARALSPAASAPSGGLDPSLPASLSASAETTIVLQQGLHGYSGASDVYLDATHPDMSQGATGRDPDTLRVWSGLQSTLVRFDLSPLPPGADVVAATLSLRSYEARYSSPLPVQVYRVLRPWVDIEATWNHRVAGERWTVPGCMGAGSDLAETPLDAQTLTLAVRWYDWDVTDAVRQWASGAADNHGLVLLASASASYHILRSSNWWQAPSERPKLTVVVRLPTPTPTATHTTTPTHTPTPTVTPTATETPLPSATPTGTLIPTSTCTPTETLTPTPTDTPTATPTFTPIPPGATVIFDFQNGVMPQPSYSGVNDTYIDPNEPTANLGSGPYLKVNSDGRQRSLLRFDLATHIPPHAVVTSAQLSLYSLFKAIPAGMDLGVYEVLRPWTEHGATWHNAASTHRWQQPDPIRS